jgi:hypothetical protein
VSDEGFGLPEEVVRAVEVVQDPEGAETLEIFQSTGSEIICKHVLVLVELCGLIKHLRDTKQVLQISGTCLIE